MLKTVSELLLPSFSHFEESFSEDLLELAEVCNKKKNDKLTIQYDLGTYFYILTSGEVLFSIKVEGEKDELVVGQTNEVNTPIGWSGFREPYRYATTVTCKTDCTFIRWRHEQLREIVSLCPASGAQFIKYVMYRGYSMLQEIRSMLVQSVPDVDNTFLDLIPFQSITKESYVDSVETLKKSPFFEVFNEDELDGFHACGQLREWSRGEKIYRQNVPSETLGLLVSGKVALVYQESEESSKLDKSIIDTEGYIVGSGCYTEDGINHVSCVSLANSVVFHLNKELLESYLNENPKVAVKFYLRMLWFISTRLRAGRAKLIALNYDGEISAVKNLIEQNCTQLDVLSSLHKVPHLLKSTFTLDNGISLLKDIAEQGSTMEKSLAKNALKVLSEVVKENDFYGGLANIYSQVVNSPDDWSAREVRDFSSQKFLDVFEGTNYVLSGAENLPEEASIFIYNHLENHVYNTLPNNFQLTLDSHFISSVVLYKHYKNSGIRVVRVPKGDEYGHQFYYNKLGHITVYTKDSEVLNETPEESKRRRNEFYQTASDYLQQGTSILLAPEGQSFSTGMSPGKFKPGAFYLTTKMEKEPFIVPIAVANFDKRLNQTTFSAVIKKPFKLSERVEDPTNRAEMASFLEEYRKEYRTYIEEALDLSKGSQWMEIIK